MKLFQVILILAAVTSIYSWKQVEILAGGDDLTSTEVDRWSAQGGAGPTLATTFKEFSCDSGSNKYFGGNGKFTQNVELKRALNLQEHTTLQLSFDLVLIDFTSDDKLRVYLDNTLLKEFGNTDLTAINDETVCEQGSTALVDNSNYYAQGTYTTSGYTAHSFEQADLKFVLINDASDSSTASWGIHSIVACTNGNCDADRTVTEFTTPCSAGEHYFKGGCKTEAFIDACYAHQDELKVVGDSTKFTRSAALQNSDTEILLKWVFTAQYVLDKDCTNYEINVQGNKLAIDYSGSSFVETTPGSEEIFQTYTVSDLVENYNCPTRSDADFIYHECATNLSIYSNHGLQYREKFNLTVKFSKTVQNDISVEVETKDDEDISDCCENTLNITTDLVICGTDSNCNNPQDGSAASPYVAYRDEGIYFRQRITDSDFTSKGNYLKLKTFSYGYGFFPELKQSDITFDEDYAQWKFTPMFAGNSIEFSAISIVTDNSGNAYDEVDTSKNSLNRRRVLEDDDKISNDYKLKNTVTLNVINRTTSSQNGSDNDGNLAGNNGNAQQITNERAIGEQSSQNTKGDDTTLIAIISAFIGAILISLLAGAYYIKFIRNRENKYKESENKNLQQSQDVESKDFGSTTVQNLKTFDNVKESN